MTHSRTVGARIVAAATLGTMFVTLVAVSSTVAPTPSTDLVMAGPLDDLAGPEGVPPLPVPPSPTPPSTGPGEGGEATWGE